MVTLTIEINEDKLSRLKSAADELGMPIEQYVAKTIDSALVRKELVNSTFDYVLKKNAELYRRLAK